MEERNDGIETKLIGKPTRKHETEHIVAILDLLGASDIIMGDTSENVLNALSNIFYNAESTWPFLGNVPEVLQNIKCVTFSDNIALALELSTLRDQDEAIKAFIKYISVFQGAALKTGFLFRGGIALGQLYMDSSSNFVWGKALVEAHVLEEKSAIYPRVVLSRQFDKFDLPNMPRVRLDFDGLYFVDYVPTINKTYPEWIERTQIEIRSQVVAREGKSGQERVLQKYGWLQRYIDQCNQSVPTINTQVNMEKCIF